MISLVVPVLTPKWLVGFFRTLPAACKGLPVPVEVIILDNREPDVSDFSFGFAYQTRVVYHDPPVTFHACWNAGVRLAKGDVIIVVNDDVLWGPRSVTRLYEALMRFDLFCCYPTPAVSEAAFNLDIVHEPARLIGPPEFRGWCQAWTRGGFEAVGYFDESFELFYGDDDAWMRLIDGGKPARQVASSLVYHIGSQSVKTLGEDFVRAVKARDKARFDAKWGRSPQQFLREVGLCRRS